MSQVIFCSKSPFAKAQRQYGGVRFFNSKVGRISEEITDEQVAEFLKTPEFFRLHMDVAIPVPHDLPELPKAIVAPMSDEDREVMEIQARLDAAKARAAAVKNPTPVFRPTAPAVMPAGSATASGWSADAAAEAQAPAPVVVPPASLDPTF